MEIRAPKERRILVGLKHSELLDMIKLASCDQFDMSKSEAYKEFCYRYGNFLYKTCTIACTNYRYDETVTKDIFQETIIKALKKVHEFIYDPTDTEKVIGKKIAGWLGKIANRELINYFRKNSHEEPLDDLLLETVADNRLEDFDASTFIPISSERFRLQEALSKLTDRERYVIMVYAEYHCINNQKRNNEKKEPNKHLPDEVSDRLCSELQIEKGNLRVLKKRALDKIFAYLANY